MAGADARPYVLRGWPLSLYSGKARAYLRHKGLAFVERSIRLWDFAGLKKKVGAVVMPVVVTPQGEWLQDTADLIATLERRHPEHPMLPATPRQRIAALLLEAWGDEFWIPAAMHYRWGFRENYDQLFRRDAGDHLLPFFPRALKDRVAARSANLMRSYLPGIGVVAEQVGQIEAWTNAMLDALDAHFAHMPFLLGERPTVADFGLIGPLFAHLGRDPYPARALIATRPHLQAWVTRVHAPVAPARGALAADDRVPETLAPLWRSVFAEFWPMVAATHAEMRKTLAAGQPLRRALGPMTTPLAGSAFTRASTPFCVWKLQRVRDALAALPPDEQRTVHAWAAALGGSDALTADLGPRLRRVGLRVAVA